MRKSGHCPRGGIHGGERPVEVAVQDQERAMSASVLDAGCTEASFSRERSIIPHRVLRGRRGHKGWGPGGAKACQTLPAVGCADELRLPSLEGADEEVGIEAAGRSGCRKRKWRTGRKEGVGAIVPLMPPVRRDRGGCMRESWRRRVSAEARRRGGRRRRCGRSNGGEATKAVVGLGHGACGRA